MTFVTTLKLPLLRNFCKCFLFTLVLYLPAIPQHPLSTHPSIPPPTHPLTPPYTHPSIHPPTHPSIHPPTHPLTPPYTHPSIHPPTHPSMHPHTHPFMHSSMNPPIYEPTHPLLNTPTHPPTPPCTHPPTHPPLHAPTRDEPACVRASGQPQAEVFVNGVTLPFSWPRSCRGPIVADRAPIAAVICVAWPLSTPTQHNHLEHIVMLLNWLVTMSTKNNIANQRPLNHCTQITWSSTLSINNHRSICWPLLSLVFVVVLF